MILRLTPLSRDYRIPGVDVLLHLGLTGVMAWLGVLMFQPEPTMIGPAWAPFLRYMTEPEWGAAFSFAAVMGAIGLVSQEQWLKMASAFLLGCAHVTLSYLIIKGHDPNSGTTVAPGAGVYACLAFLGYGLAFYRIGTLLGFVRGGEVVLNLSRLR